MLKQVINSYLYIHCLQEEEYLTTVKQFEYTAWKERYQAPGDTSSLLEMIDVVLKWQPHLSESQPVLVHCRYVHLLSCFT